MICEREVGRYCYQDASMIENYYQAVADTEHMWDCHHRVETIMNCGADELKAQGCYFDRPANELIFLRRSDHWSMHKKGKPLSEEERQKRFGDGNPMWGKHHTEESKRKMGDAKRGEKSVWWGKKHTEETLRKMSEKRREYWARKKAQRENNGTISIS